MSNELFETKTRIIKEYFEYLIKAKKEKGISYGIDLISYDINKIIDAKEEEKISIGSFLDKRIIKISV